MTGYRPRLIAHRGFAAEFPENTLTAVQNAARHADAIEVDVRRCGTGELVAFHDRWVGPFWRRQRIDYLSRKELANPDITGCGEPIPTLSELLSAVPSETQLILEIKDAADAREVAERVLDSPENVVISSSKRRALDVVDQIDPDISTAFVHLPMIPQRGVWPLIRHVRSAVNSFVDIDSLLSDVLTLGCDELHVRYELCLATDLVDQAHEAGKSVGAWTIRTPDAYQSVVRTGVDGVFADSWRVCGDGIS